MEYQEIQMLEQANQGVFNPSQEVDDIQREKAVLIHIEGMRQGGRDLIQDAALLKDLETNFDQIVHATEKHIELLEEIRQAKTTCRDNIRKVIDTHATSSEITK